MYGNKEEGFVADRAIGWQGGSQEIYSYLSPLMIDVLKELTPYVGGSSSSDGGLVARVNEQILLDFDGTSLLTAEHPSGPLYDIQAILQPSTDDYYRKTILKIEEQFSDTEGKSKRLFLLVNPVWRDKNSWGFFGANRAQKEILDRYKTTFAMDQFVVRGRKISLLRTWSSHDDDGWSVFLTLMPYEQKREEEENCPKCIGTFSKRPSYIELDALVKSNIINSAG